MKHRRGHGSHRLRSSVTAGRAAAARARAQRVIEDDVRRYAFDPRPFDGTMTSLIVQVTAHAAPWLRDGPQCLLNRMSLWLFGVDRATDEQARSEADVDGVIAAALAVVDGEPAAPGNGLFGLLAEIRADLSTYGTYPELATAWRHEVHEMLLGMRREVGWRQGPAPTVEQYLANAQSTGMRLLYLTFLIVDGAGRDDWAPGRNSLREAADATIRVMRLVNDVGGHERESTFGDIDIFTLGLSRTQIDREVRTSMKRCLSVLARQPARRRRWASYLERVMGFSAGLYGATGDYWGPS